MSNGHMTVKRWRVKTEITLRTGTYSEEIQKENAAIVKVFRNTPEEMGKFPYRHRRTSGTGIRR